MATLIGVVRLVVGEVFAVAADGSKRQLGEGDRVFAGEQLLTGDGGAVAIRLVNGGELTVGRDSSLQLDTELLAGEGARARIEPATPEHVPSAEDLADVEEVQQAIAAGADPTLSLPATAAGAGGAAGDGGGGISFVMLDETAGRVDPTIGYPTGPLQFEPRSPEVFPTGVEETPDPAPSIAVEYFSDATGQVLVQRGFVDEGALPGGSRAGSDAEISYGRVSITSPDGIAAVQIQDKNGNWVDVTSGGIVQGQYGTLVVAPGGTWVFTLDSSAPHVSPTLTGASDQSLQGFPVRVIDNDGDVSPPVTLLIDIADDGPTAFANGNGVTEGGVVTGNVLTDGTDDVFGADGPTAGGGVVGVRAAGGDTTTAVSTGVGATIGGLYGTLTLHADGSYTYDGNPDAVPQGGASEVFVYTIRDGDGDLSTTTLTIELSDSGLATGSDEQAVDEAALAGGSNPLSNAETIAGSVADNVQGGTGPYTYTLQGSGAGSYGTLTLNADGSYSYTLSQPYDSAPDTDNGAHTENDAEVFTFLVTDGNGNTQTGTITIDIVDDVPSARADLKTGVEGEVVTGNVLTDGAADVFGADGPTAGGGVVGVRLAGGDTTSAVTSGVGTLIGGLYGTLTLQADGSYSYDGDPDVVPPGGVSEVFVYTIRDGDGDLSTATLTIELSDSRPSAPDDQEVLVYENALDFAKDGADLAAGTVTGSLPGSTGETDTGNQLDATGVVPLSYALVGNANGNYGTIRINADGSYTYTLTKPYDSRPEANDGANVERGVDTFIYRVTDANGNTMTGTVRIDIVDDVPTARADLNEGVEGALVKGNVLSDGTADVFGADGPAAGGGVVGVRAAGGDATTAVTSGVGATITGLYGTLTLLANGSYTYDGAPNAVPQGGASDVFVYTIKDGDGDLSTATLTIQLSDSGLSASSDDRTVNEAALSSGSNPLSNAETTAGTVADNVLGGSGPYTYALQGSGTGSYGTLTLNPDGSYSYTLTRAYDTAPDADNGTQTENDAEIFTYRVTDANGNSQTGTIRIDIVDDVPTARADLNTVVEGGVVGGNVLSDGADDVFGADGPSAGGGVVGVRAGSDTSTPASTGVGTTVTGLYGTLTLLANGSYTYVGRADAVTAAGASDVFVYTIRDGDGDLSTTTLTIQLSDSGLSAPADQEVRVYENALDLLKDGLDLAPGTVTGSLPGSGSETDASNQLEATGVVPLTYALVGSAEGSYGVIKINPDGSYTYTLTKPYDSSPEANDGANVERGVDTFTYRVTDGNGNVLTGTIRIDIVDDVPIAHANIDAVIEGDAVSGNVLDYGVPDVFGADGAAVGGGVVGVRAAGSDTTTAVITGVGTTITGLYGTLTLEADGSYRYESTPNAVPELGASDVFVYTIRDGDGDLATTTLTIYLADSDLIAPDDQEVRVFENALDLAKDGADLAAGSVTGSLPTSTGETDANNLLNASGLGSLSYALVGDAAGTYGTIQINPNGSYTYTLTKPYDSSPDANDGANVERGVDTFTYRVTDGNGNTLTGTIRIDIVDDVPTARADLNSVVEGGVAGGNVLTDGADDVFGADGAAAGGGVVGVRAAAGDLGSAVTTGVGATIVGLYGTLILQADGSYRYDGTPNAVPQGGASDVFVYTIKDGDGDLSTTTLTINLSDSGLTAPEDRDARVYESALDLKQDGTDLAAATVTGSLPLGRGETDADNQLNASGVGTLSYSLVGDAAGDYGVIRINADGSYTYTLTKPYTSSPEANDGANVESGVDTFTYRVTDGNGNTQTGTIRIDIVDDVPKAFLPEHVMQIDQVSETRSISGDLRFADAAGADGVGDVAFTFTEGVLAIDANGNKITLDDQQLYLYYGEDSTQLVARTGPNGKIGFIIDIDPATDSYTLKTFGVLSNDTSIVLSNLSGVGSAGNVNVKGLINAGGTLQDVLMSSTSGSINSTSSDVAIGNQWIDATDNIRFDFLNDLAVDAASSTGFSYSSHNLISSFRQGIAQVQGSNGTVNLTILAIIADNDNVFGSGDAGESYVPLSTSDIRVYDKLGNDVTGSVTLVDNGDSITIKGLYDDWSYEVSSATQFSALQVSGASGSAPFALGTFSYTQVLPDQPIELSYRIEATDGDGDAIFSSLQATLYPRANTLEGDAGNNTLPGSAAADWIFGHDGNDSLSGLIGNDALAGGNGADILNGGQGSDLLSGGAGADAFVWSPGDSGVDRITDFTPGEDHLDLSDLLVGIDGSLGNEDLASSLASYLSMTFGASTTITVNPDAAGPLPANQSIVLEGVDLSLAYETTDQATIIQNMLDDGSLKVV